VRVRSKQYLAVLALVALAIGVGYALRLEMQPVPTTEPPPADTIAFGVYDPWQQFSDTPNISIEHIFVPWQKLPADMGRSIQQIEARERQLMVTIEPWTDAADRVTGGEDLFGSILAGDHDSRIEAICGEFAGAKTPVLVRWAHEMEDPTGRYPWARTNAEGYIGAFRRFVDRCRTVAPAVRFIWSPKGEPNLDRYYPGDAYVDYVGLSVFTLQAWDLDRYGMQRTFNDVVAEKYQRVAHYGKPIVIAEFAVFGDNAYLEHFFSNFRQSLPEFPALVALVYFNDKEPHYWPDGYGSPDWRVMTDHYFRLTTAAGVHS
jgi:beta-mannanase